MSHGARRHKFAAASRFWSIPNLMPRSTVTRVWLTEWTHLGQLCGTLTSDNLFFFFFFFFFLSFRECCLTRQWQSTECDTRYMVQRKKFDVILRFLVDGYRRTKPPKPDASQVVVPWSSATSKTGNRFGWSFFFAVWRRCQKSTAHEQRAVVLVESQGSCALVRIVRLPKIWQEGQHDLHSPPGQPIDWREHTTGAVHDRNLPTRSLQVPESYENFLWHRVKVRSIVTGLCRDDERDDDRSHRRVSIMSSLDAGWFRLITNILIQSRDLAMIARWHQCGTMTSQIFARASFSAVCLTVFPFEFRPRTFTIGFYGKNSIISELMILECSFPLIGLPCFVINSPGVIYSRQLLMREFHSVKRGSYSGGGVTVSMSSFTSDEKEIQIKPIQ